VALLAVAAALMLAVMTSKYEAAVRYERIANSAARAALSDRITSLEHDVVDAHNQVDSLRRQVEVNASAIRAALAPDSRIIHLAPLGAAPNASAVVAESAIKGEAVLLVDGLPPAPSGEIYQLWWLGPHGEATKAAAFHLDAHGAAIVTATPPPAAARAVAGEVTLQSSQSADKPGGTIYFRGATAAH
jgi:Anti-sigma-K factor rskA, C-terminal